jgi:hypothetical protein
MTTTTQTPASRLAIVQPPPGTNQCAFGETTYNRNADDTMIVPVEALPGLLHVAGFTLLALEDLPPAPALEK